MAANLLPVSIKLKNIEQALLNERDRRMASGHKYPSGIDGTEIISRSIRYITEAKTSLAILQRMEDAHREKARKERG